jgi:hypothetical protein
MNWAANIWGRFAAAHHNSGPGMEGQFTMATVTKIASAGQPPAGTIHWLNTCLERGKSEVFTERAVLVPGVAGALLSANPNNRNLSEKRVAQYAKDMVEGHWTFNGEPIIVASTGELNDGQHRAQAVIVSNRPQEMLFVFGVTRDSRVTVDQGAARTAGHYLAMDGIKNANVCAGIARIVLAYEESNGTKTRNDASNAEVFERVRRDEDIQRAANYAVSVQKFARGILTASYIGSAFYIFSEIDEKDAKEFLDQVCIGENIKRGDPAFTVRNALANHDSAGTHNARRNAIEVLFRGWIAFRQGRKLTLAKCLGVLPALV